MVKVIHLDDDGVEVAAIELDDFTIETVYAGIADMLRDVESRPHRVAVPTDFSRAARLRREKILTRLHA